MTTPGVVDCDPPEFVANQALFDDGARFEVGKTYRTLGGKEVTIIQRRDTPGYECVQGDDISDLTGVGIWRYNRRGCIGRVTGSPHWSNTNNLLLGA